MNINSCALVFAGLLLILVVLQINTAFSASCKTRNYSHPETQFIHSVQELGVKISHTQWSLNPNDNVVLSPLGIAIILNLLMLGTNGTANLEIRKALNFSNDLQEEIIHKTFKEILLSLPQSDGKVKIYLNTKLFPREGSEILDSFKNNSKRWYFTDTQNLDFRGSPNTVAKKINNWVSNSTKGKIVKVSSLPLNPDTVCTAYSVSVLNAKWKNKFNINLTKNGTFNTGKENITIPMMTSVFRVPYLRDEKEKIEIISLPYEGNSYSMYIIKPICNTAISKLIHLEDDLNSSYLNSVIGQMTTQKLLVTIPKMRLTQSYDLEISLKSLGIKEIFNKNSKDFKRFSEKQKLFVSTIFHEALLDITEDGTSGGTVSNSVMSSSSTSNPKRFILDKPSLLLVRNNENGLILFWIKVLKPESLTASNLSSHLLH